MAKNQLISISQVKKKLFYYTKKICKIPLFSFSEIVLNTWRKWHFLPRASLENVDLLRPLFKVFGLTSSKRDISNLLGYSAYDMIYKHTQLF